MATYLKIDSVTRTVNEGVYCSTNGVARRSKSSVNEITNSRIIQPTYGSRKNKTGSASLGSYSYDHNWEDYITPVRSSISITIPCPAKIEYFTIDSIGGKDWWSADSPSIYLYHDGKSSKISTSQITNYMGTQKTIGIEAIESARFSVSTFTIQGLYSGSVSFTVYYQPITFN